jgi:hypothetical protein
MEKRVFGRLQWLLPVLIRVETDWLWVSPVNDRESLSKRTGIEMGDTLSMADRWNLFRAVPIYDPRRLAIMSI